jgi:tRNA 2-thiouridine synthesizing protein B
MTTLHIVRQSAFTTNDFYQCLQLLGNDDCVVFTDDGCYNLQHHLIDTIHSDNSKNIQLMALSSHAKARAITIKPGLCTEIDMAALVSLTFNNDRVITWQ